MIRLFADARWELWAVAGSWRDKPWCEESQMTHDQSD